MDQESARRVAASFDRIAPRLDAMVEGFYRRLFERAPQVRALFSKDMTRQREHLAASLAIIARNTIHLDILREPLMELGVQHIVFGARPEHYPIVRDAMLDAIGEAMGPAWTDQLRGDWLAALNDVVALMLRGAVTTAIDAAVVAPARADAISKKS
jgi:hemoglobin-like flavoprotein